MSINYQDLSQLEKLYFEGRFPELESCAINMTKEHPEHGLAWSVLGAALAGQGKPSLEAFAKAAQLLPLDAQAQLQYADALFSAGRFDDSVPLYQRALVLQPGWTAAHNNLGNTFKELGLLSKARAQYELALQSDQKFALAHYNLAMLDRDTNQNDRVELELRRALDADPGLVMAWVELGSLLKTAGDLVGAEQALLRAVGLAPGLLQARLNLAAILLLRNAAADSLHILQDTIILYPLSASAHLQLGRTLNALGRAAEARASVVHALSLQEDLIEGQMFLANLFSESGDIEEAICCLERVIDLDSTNIPANSALLFYKAQVASVRAQKLFNEHVAFGRLLDRKYRDLRLPVADPGTHRPDRLRVGLVSGDFNNHIVSRSLLPVLEHLAALENVELFAYCNNLDEDDWTSKLKTYFSSWQVVEGMTPDTMASRIRADDVNILMDLAGHTPMNCLETFSLRPAPVQVSWLGYTWTTGLNEIDYYFADKYWLPPGQFDHLFVEKLVYLDAFLPFEFRGQSPLVNSLPFGAGAQFTFGSFNHVRKISNTLLNCWSQVLLALPNSRLLLCGINEGPQHRRILDTFRDLGIAADRLLFYPRCNPYDYLKLHHLVDLCLDAFPYPSATTVQHAAWMGVPTVTFCGQTPVSRAGASVMLQLGLSKFIAASESEYTEIAIQTALNLTELAALRPLMRAKLVQSAQCQCDKIARSVHHALRTMWSRYCDGRPSQTFDTTLN